MHRDKRASPPARQLASSPQELLWGRHMPTSAPKIGWRRQRGRARIEQWRPPETRAKGRPLCGVFCPFSCSFFLGQGPPIALAAPTHTTAQRRLGWTTPGTTQLRRRRDADAGCPHDPAPHVVDAADAADWVARTQTHRAKALSRLFVAEPQPPPAARSALPSVHSLPCCSGPPRAPAAIVLCPFSLCTTRIVPRQGRIRDVVYSEGGLVHGAWSDARFAICHRSVSLQHIYSVRALELQPASH